VTSTAGYGGAVDDQLARAVEAAIVPIVASLGSWGVDTGHWLPDRGGAPVIWLHTRTEEQRRALSRQVWLLPQVQVTLTRLGVPHEVVWRLRIELTSQEDEERLFAE
jgi:hypothetical protein